MPMLPVSARRLLISALRPRGRVVRRKEAGNIPVAIFKPDRLGDFILATGAIRRAMEVHGPGNCALIVADFAVEIARLLFPDSLVLGVPDAHNDLFRGVLPGLRKMRPVLSQYRFEKLICLRHQRSIFQELLLGRIATQESYGLRNTMECILPSDRGLYEYPFTRCLPYPAVAPASTCREIEANRQVLSLAWGKDVPIDDVLPRIELPPASENLSDAVIVSPFASTVIRTYPLPRMVEVLRCVQQERPVRFLLSSTPGDAPRLEELRRLAEAAGVRDVAVRTPSSFVEFCSLVAAARGVISVDTSTAHLATALDRPAAIILGGGQYGDFGPWSRSSRQIWFTHEVPCFGCLWSCIHREALCITLVPPAEIAAGLVARI